MVFPKCSLKKPVPVRDYPRIRYGKKEHVRAHCRGLPSR